MMYRMAPLDPIDYLMIGHLTRDLTPNGSQLGGTAAYSALAARALGLRVGVLTACEDCLSTPELEREGVDVVGMRSDVTTTFENRYDENGRTQYLHSVATTIDLSMVPEIWRNASIVHLGPVANEVDPMLVRAFPSSMVALTPQGWMRTWDQQGRVHFTDWPEASFILSQAGVAVLSIHDVHEDEDIIQEMASAARVLAVTDGPNGCRVFWNGDVRRFRPPAVIEVDPTGAGDVFATSFFYRLQTTRDPWEAGRFATHLASYTVQRPGLEGIPTQEEIQACMTEII